MGLKAGSAVGDMPTVPGYEDECKQFLIRQIEIVKPSVIVALGQKAGKRVRAANEGFVVEVRTKDRMARVSSQIAARTIVLGLVQFFNLADYETEQPHRGTRQQ